MPRCKKCNKEIQTGDTCAYCSAKTHTSISKAIIHGLGGLIVTLISVFIFKQRK